MNTTAVHYQLGLYLQRRAIRGMAHWRGRSSPIGRLASAIQQTDKDDLTQQDVFIRAYAHVREWLWSVLNQEERNLSGRWTRLSELYDELCSVGWFVPATTARVYLEALAIVQRRPQREIWRWLQSQARQHTQGSEYSSPTARWIVWLVANRTVEVPKLG